MACLQAPNRGADRVFFKVVAWLGRGDKDTQKAIAFVEKLFSFLEDMQRKGVHPTLKTSARLHSVPSQFHESRNRRALRDLLANSCFERLWVVQEIVMAPVVKSRPSCLEDPIILAFEKCTISFDAFAKVVQTIYDDHLHEELLYDHISKDSIDQLGKYPSVRTYMSFLLPL